jgi:phage repressor protein C with HTH and peptisase S24 domain
MFPHKQIWAAFDAIAEAGRISVSALSKRAGLDAAAFNPSKRFSRSGRERWPSTETLSKVLSAAGMDLRSLADIIDSLPTNDTQAKTQQGSKAKAKNLRRG